MKKFFAFFLALSIFTSLTAQAGTSISLEDAKRLAVENSNLIKAADIQIEYNEINAREALAAKNRTKNVAPPPGLGLTSSIEQTKTRRGFYSDAAAMELELSRLSKQRLINSIEFGAVNSYYTLINANEMLNVKKQSLEIAKENLNSVKLKYDLGSVSKAEVEAAEFAVNKTEIELDTLKRSVEFSRLSFNNILGLKNDEYYILSNKLEITEPENIDLDECIKSALDKRFEMNAARLSLSLAEKEAECYGAFYTKQTYFYKLKEHNVEMKKAELENAEKNIILAIKKSYFDYLDSYNNVLLSNIAVQNAELAYNMAKSMFETGAGTNQEVIKAQNDLDLARLQKVQAQTAYFLSKLAFDSSLNVGIETN